MAAEHSRAPPSDNPTYPSKESSNLQSPQKYPGDTTMHNNMSEGGVSTGHQSYSNATPQTNGAYSSRPPIHEAVNSAFDKSTAASQVDPNLVAQITEQVINSLKASGITGGAQAQSQQQTQQPPLQHPTPAPAATHAYSRSSAPRSPASPESSSIPLRYTPPSPSKHASYSTGSSSPEPQASDTASHNGRDQYQAPQKRSPRRRDSSHSHEATEDMSASRTRPKPLRVPSLIEETTLEKIWKPLFDNGRPTSRLGQFLRGLAKHIIEDCEPRNSIVITPGKLADFFEATRIPDELYPWHSIFGGRLTNASISRLYRDLRCQHHLVQFNFQDVPNIPGLTPYGFEAFMTTLILAHPEQEFERMARAVLEMPISNADDSKERFPKELSRRLLPRTEDVQQQQRLVAALSVDPAVQIRSSNSMPPPPPTAQPQSQSQPPPPPPPPSMSQASSFMERERNPYSSASSFSSAIDDDDLRSTPIPIERERKPYTAREGSGKMYEQERANAAMHRHDSTRQSRANSNLPAPPPFQQSSRPTDIPNANRAHRMSMTGSQMRYGSSVPMSNPYTRSEGNNVGETPPMYYASNIQSDGLVDDMRKFPRGRAPEDDIMSRSYGPPSRGMSVDQHPGVSTNGRPNGSGTDGYGSFANFIPPPPPPPNRY